MLTPKSNALPLTLPRLPHDAACWCTDGLGVARVYVCTIPSRLHHPSVQPSYTDRVEACNHYLQETLSVEEKVFFWKLLGLYWRDSTVHTRDGVHFNDWGNYKLYRSVRGGGDTTGIVLPQPVALLNIFLLTIRFSISICNWAYRWAYIYFCLLIVWYVTPLSFMTYFPPPPF